MALTKDNQLKAVFYADKYFSEYRGAGRTTPEDHMVLEDHMVRDGVPVHVRVEAVRIVNSRLASEVPKKITVERVRQASEFLQEGLDALIDRAESRDKPNGERSMLATVEMFKVLTGHELTEPQGWQFMVLLKMVRGSQGAFRADDYTDQAAYSALAGESASKGATT